MSKIPQAYVLSDSEAALPELISAARHHAGRVTVLAIESETVKAVASEYGAEEVVLFPANSDVVIEDYVPSFAGVLRSGETAGVVLISASRRGRCIAAKLGVELNCAVMNEASEISFEGGIHAKRTVYGGLARQSEVAAGKLAILTLAKGSYEAVKTTTASPQLRHAAFVEPKIRLKLVSRKPIPAATVDLASAKRVVCVGRGFGKKEDLSLAANLARSIGAELGCSRPVAEGQGWMERERYIGVSGVALKSDVYFALGVSGQIQHMVGANAAKTIIAVNKDKNAPIFKAADIGIVGDLYKVIPALIAGLK
jgi:electron transfer flavoprotein alpha subunit